MNIRVNLVHEPSLGIDIKTPSRTQQQFKEECDVNNILRNYVNTGVLNHVSGETPVFGDFSQVPEDYGEALALIRKSEEQFSTLPSEIREKFDNQPMRLVKWLENSENRAEAEKLGIINKRVEPVDKSTD